MFTVVHCSQTLAIIKNVKIKKTALAKIIATDKWKKPDHRLRQHGTSHVLCYKYLAGEMLTM